MFLQYIIVVKGYSLASCCVLYIYKKTSIMPVVIILGFMAVVGAAA